MSCGTWVKLTRQSGQPLYLNMELAGCIAPVVSVDGKHSFTEIMHERGVWCVKETPEQIFLALSKDAVYPWGSLPGAVFTPPSVGAQDGQPQAT